MNLPVNPPLKPMLAKLVAAVPEGMLYEPKFDGFRCIIFKDGGEVLLGSRNERPMNRYFPEIVAAAQSALPERCVVDGEIVVIIGGRLEFEMLQQRIHPAASRVKLLAAEIPASFIAFDLLAEGDESLMDVAFAQRRTRLSALLGRSHGAIHLAPSTDSQEVARRWFEEFEGAGLDGVIAKPRDIKYVPDRRIMFKIKHERTADCVVAGFRWHKSGIGVGSLMLGLYRPEGFLQPVGVAASFSAAKRKKLEEELSPFRLKQGESHPWGPDGSFEKAPSGESSRWNAQKDMSWEPLRPELVVEVGYDYMEGDRFRHVAYFKRWRPDRNPESCTFEQLEKPLPFDLARVLKA
ncbi:MAG: ATP-dependent DNA ligase [Actinomycetota bacterium]